MRHTHPVDTTLTTGGPAATSKDDLMLWLTQLWFAGLTSPQTVNLAFAMLSVLAARGADEGRVMLLSAALYLWAAFL